MSICTARIFQTAYPPQPGMFPLIPEGIPDRYFLGLAVIPPVPFHHLPPGVHHPTFLSADGIMQPPWAASDTTRALITSRRFCTKQMSAQQTRLLCDLAEGVATPGKGLRQVSWTATAAHAGSIYSDLGANRWFSRPIHTFFFFWHCQKGSQQEWWFPCTSQMDIRCPLCLR